MARTDHYAVLGVKRDASGDEIKRAYRRLALECHPDRFPDDAEAEARFREVSEAYAVLGDPQERARYDRAMTLPEVFETGRPAIPTPRELFDNVFGDVLGSKRRRRRRGRDVRYTLTVGLEEAVHGSAHEIEYEANGPCSDCRGNGTRAGGRAATECEVCEGRGEVRSGGLFARRSKCGRCDGMGMIQQDPCPTCRGRGSRREHRRFNVRIPPGTRSGAERTLRGHGEPGRFGGEPGDLKVTINVDAHPWLTRDEWDLSMELPVTVSEATRGATRGVPTVDGWVDLEVPAGVGGGTRLRLRGKGVPKPEGGRGDQYVRIVVEVPRAPSPAVLSALDALDRALASDPASTPRRQALIDAWRESQTPSESA
jgi:molecular chaperone DnaJ